jgi:Cys-tRNA(Pro)/Cys-tRNA(Cys) deacylase
VSKGFRKTNAIRLLEGRGIEHEVRTYELDYDQFSAEEVARLLELPPATVFKTLAARDGEGTIWLAVVPGNRDLDLKALARAAGTRRMELLPVADLLGVTGYRRGSVTALGTRRRLPVIVDRSAVEHERIAVSGGSRGVQILLDPEAYVEATGAGTAPIGRS